MEVPSGDSIWGVLIALIVVIGSIVAGRRGQSTPPPATPPTPTQLPLQPGATPEHLQVSPEVWTWFNNRITSLEGKVDHLTELVEAGTARESNLSRLLRIAVRSLTRANKRLRRASLDEEPMDRELIPYSID